MTTGTWTRLRSGDWGARVKGAPAPASEAVLVKRSGEESRVVIDRVLWTDGDIAICSVHRAASTEDHYCAECGRILRGKGKECRDASGLLGMCCSRCAAGPAHERSFM